MGIVAGAHSDPVRPGSIDLSGVGTVVASGVCGSPRDELEPPELCSAANAADRWHMAADGILARGNYRIDSAAQSGVCLFRRCVHRSHPLSAMDDEADAVLSATAHD